MRATELLRSEDKSGSAHPPEPLGLSGTIDREVRATSRWSWFWVAALGVLLATGVVWAFTARIPQLVTASGIVIVPSNVVVVAAPADGLIQALPPCTPGCTVTAGQALFVIQAFGDARPTTVTAPQTGSLGATSVLTGQEVQQGDPLTTVELADGDPDASEPGGYFAFLAANEQVAGEFHRGATVYVSPESDGGEDGGSMIGVVTGVTQVPVTLGDAHSAPEFQITVDLGTAPAWTAGPPEQPVANGSRVTVSLVTSDPHPIELAGTK